MGSAAPQIYRRPFLLDILYLPLSMVLPHCFLTLHSCEPANGNFRWIHKNLTQWKNMRAVRRHILYTSHIHMDSEHTRSRGGIL